MTENLKVKRRLLIIRLILIFLSLGLIVWGAARGENKMTRSNAHYLCLECLGIGD